MAEISWPWTDSTGDGGPYSRDYLRSWAKAMTLEPAANAGVFRGELFDLLIQQGSGTDMVVRTGRALVNGTYYENGTTLTKTQLNPAVGTTGRRIVLQKDWTAQTIRAVILLGTDGTASLPPLTQTSGTKWEIPLASWTISTTGTIAAFTDERVYLPAPDAKRERWFPVTAAAGGGALDLSVQGTHPGAQLSASATTHAYIEVNIPFDFVTILNAYLVSVTTAGGNIQREIDIQYAAVGEAYNAAVATVGPGTRSMTANQINEEDISSAFSGTAPGDYVGIDYWRDGANGADANTGTTQVLGLRLAYKCV